MHVRMHLLALLSTGLLAELSCQPVTQDDAACWSVVSILLAFLSKPFQQFQKLWLLGCLGHTNLEFPLHVAVILIASSWGGQQLAGGRFVERNPS